MTEPVLPYASVGEEPTITRDRTAVILTAIAGVALLPMVLDCILGNWIEGRSNCRVGGPFGFGCLALPVWLLASVWLLIRVTVKMHVGSAAQRIRWILMVLFVWFPLLDLLSSFSIAHGVNRLMDPGFMPGFASWVNANVNAQAIRQWSATTPLNMSQPVVDLGSWLALPPAGASVLPVPKANWPSNLASLALEEMYILSDRSAVILFWGVHGTWNYKRMVIIQNPGAASFSFSHWPPHLAQNAVWVCVRYPA